VRAHARAHIGNAHCFTECVVIHRCLCGIIRILVCCGLWIFLVKLFVHHSACLVGSVAVVYSMDACEDSLRENNEPTLMLLDRLRR